MNKKNTNIESYFQKAKNQEVPFSKDDARNLIENHSTGFLSDKSKKIKGVNKMTFISASIVTMAIIGLSVFNSTDNDDITKENKNPVEISASADEIPAKDVSKQDITEIPEKISNKDPNSVMAYNEKDKVREQQLKEAMEDNTTLQTEGIDIIRLNKEQFGEIGIKINGNEEFEFLIPSKLMNIKYKINVNEGMTFEEVYDTAFSNTTAPTFITKESGEKIFGRFTTDDNSMQMVYSKFIKYDTNKINKDMDFNITQMIDENIHKKIELKNKPDDSVRFHKKINLVINKDTIWEEDNSEDVSDFSRIVNEEMRDSLLDPANSEILIAKVFERLNSDSTLKKMAYNTDGFNFDIDVHDDTIVQNINIDDTMNPFNENIRVNKLLPLAFADDNEIKYIFWFDPNIELIKTLPEEYHDDLIEQFELINNNDYCEPVKAGEDTYFDILRSCNGKLKNLSAYPNPTDGALNIRFTLAEKRNLSISLHEVSGNKIKDFEANKIYNAGEIELFYDISDLQAGMYIITIQSETGEQIIQRIIKK